MSESVKQYRVGLYLNPQPSDHGTTNLSEALGRARALLVHNNDTPVAVWDENDRTVRLFAGYEEFELAH